MASHAWTSRPIRFARTSGGPCGERQQRRHRPVGPRGQGRVHPRVVRRRDDRDRRPGGCRISETEATSQRPQRHRPGQFPHHVDAVAGTVENGHGQPHRIQSQVVWVQRGQRAHCDRPTVGVP
ncbi:hypothetical protein ACFYPG_30625 [Micromonospora sp. NPDC005553]|uniref:hypothetical protein n=1 Tax=Micromonospora sp. NPDC005553 TaxID=3364232 RepID=UPI0036BC3F8F